MDWLKQREPISEIQIDGGMVRFVHADGPDAEAGILRAMIEAGFRVYSFGAAANARRRIHESDGGPGSMSADSESIALDVEPIAPPAERWTARRAWMSVEDALERIGDRLNPILVKETRQALKSRQFLITFALLLFLGWGWSILGIAMIGPGAFVGTHGSYMFMGYIVILAFPLTIVVPFGAFRSLAAEQETRTYELLSITALGTRQIVAGKLGSALLQMSVYLSAISPCLGFTYLLRGIDMLSIFLVIFWLSVVSLGLSALGLLMATVTPKKQFQVVPMVASMLGFFFSFYMSIMGTYAFLWEGGAKMFAQWQFWAVNGAMLTAFAAYFVMVCEASAARLSFASDNRSSRLRAIMVLHQMLFTGWMVLPWMLERNHQPEIYMTFMIAAGIQWYFLGAMMIGESPRLSGRVKRQLPQSFLGRIFLTWFYPGPCCGYAMALTGLLCTLATVGIGIIVSIAMGWGPSRWGGSNLSIWDHVIPFGVLGLSYITIYLGLGLLLVRTLRRFTSAGLLMSVLMQMLLILLGCVVPLIIQLTSPYLRYESYSLLQISNPFWTLSQVAFSSSLLQAPVLLSLLPLSAVVVFFMNLRGICREIRNIRIIKPQRVLEEDAKLAKTTEAVA